MTSPAVASFEVRADQRAAQAVGCGGHRHGAGRGPQTRQGRDAGRRRGAGPARYSLAGCASLRGSHRTGRTGSPCRGHRHRTDRRAYQDPRPLRHRRHVQLRRQGPRGAAARCGPGTGRARWAPTNMRRIW